MWHKLDFCIKPNGAEIMWPKIYDWRLINYAPSALYQSWVDTYYSRASHHCYYLDKPSTLCQSSANEMSFYLQAVSRNYVYTDSRTFKWLETNILVTFVCTFLRQKQRLECTSPSLEANKKYTWNRQFLENILGFCTLRFLNAPQTNAYSFPIGSTSFSLLMNCPFLT